MNFNYDKEDDYKSIFDQRGIWYHRAMMQIPDVRDKEFQNLFEGLSFNTNDLVLDFPSGGGYLKKYLPAGVKVIELESSASFAKISKCELSDWDHLPYPDKTFNTIFCCAALHHVKTELRYQFLGEANRILLPGGILCIADADANEPVTKFLNGYVDQNNSMGHKGDFLNSDSAAEFAGKLFKVVRNEICRYKWILDSSIDSSSQFLKLMFGLDKADLKELGNYLKNYLNLQKEDNDRWTIDWSLRYIHLKKTE